jgi:adenylate cyclase
VLHGSVQRMGERLRIQTSLTDAESGTILQPKRYDGKLTDLFDLQDQIAIETAKLIAPHVRERELKRSLKKHPSNMTAYDLVLQALGPLHDLDYATFSRARGLLQKAIELDPTYAPAYSYAARWHSYRIGQEWSTNTATDGSEAERLAKIAIELDPNNALALATHAHILCKLKRDQIASRLVHDQALAAGPNLALAWTLSSINHGCLENDRLAIDHALMGVKLSPLDNFTHFSLSVVSQAYFVAGNFPEAVSYGSLAYGRNRRFSGNLRIYAAALAEVGDLDEARRVVEDHKRVLPNFKLDTWSEQTQLSAKIRDRIVAGLRKAGL